MRTTLILAALLFTGCVTDAGGRRVQLGRDDLNRAKKSSQKAQETRPIDANGAGEVARAWVYEQGQYAQVRSVEKRGEQFIVDLDVVRPEQGRRTVAVDAATGAVIPSLSGRSGAAAPGK